VNGYVAFDYPAPATTAGRRDVSCTPAQALHLMNDEFIKDSAEAWTRNLLAGGTGRSRERIETIFRQAFCRFPDEWEISACLTFVDEQRSRYAEDAEFHTWADLCHVIYNANEFITVR
jgi:hypothetical protein